jgi:hypothetical protein
VARYSVAARDGRASPRQWLAKRYANALDDDRQSADHKVIWELQHVKSRASEPSVSFGVLDLGVSGLVRAAIRLDDDLSLKTNEIREIGPDRRLPAKAVPVDPMIAQRAPKHGFRPRHIATLSPRKLA